MGTPTIDTTAKTVTWSVTPPAGTDASSPYTFTPRLTASGGQVAVGSAQSVVIAAAASGFTDDFSNPTASAANWPVTLKGTADGTYAFNTGSAVLTPKASAINNVAMRHAGTFTRLSATIARAPNPSGPDYTTLSIGTGPIVVTGGDTTSWWQSGIGSGYQIALRAGFGYLYRLSPTGVTTFLGQLASNSFVQGATNVFELRLSPSGVEVWINGVSKLTSADTTYVSGGDIMIGQGEYTNGVGSVTTVTQVTAS
jgi:hypothetical protein